LGAAAAANPEPTATRAGAGGPAPTFLDAIVRQLGLKVEAAKATIDVVHVDRFLKAPKEN
jgi:uncharacterized protein (TIGR03435 family)